MNELALTESPSLRAQYAGRVDVLDKVKVLSLLPDGVHATTEMVANYYEVSPEAIDQIVKRNREELSDNGYKVMSRAEFESVIGDTLELSPQTRRVAVFSRRGILNVGLLLTGSQVAKDVRAYLLNVEEIATHEQRSEAIDRVHLAKARIEMLASTVGYLDDKWVKLKMKIQAAIGLGEEPEIDHEDMPLYVPDFLKAKGLTQAQIKSAQSWFGRRLVKVAQAEGRDLPAKRAEDTASGSVRETYAWTRKDLPLFEEVWDVYYAGDYARDEQAGLFVEVNA
ncbi:hypothetical protein [Nonomuraea pusilla]|uniref:Uncharacterized protein n=1 Tax=Nonomuraea pusilla TaxID=46177 RepID=A0A1H8KBH3_9ACTN|nr:hypothetical protein [Nonomuraea pusilla]SEN90330.1 hypothetical protein SAMN05660976_08570 [Nonomuraea pusilla]